MQKTCFLLGFMGSGKTFWGQRLAEKMGRSFWDLDQQIEAGESMPVKRLFELYGETTFRLLEREYLHRLPLVPAPVVATGGGTPCFFDNLDWMNARGLTIYLQTPVQILAQRLRQDASRPLLQEVRERDLEKRIENLLTEREPFYRKARIIAPYDPKQEIFFERLLQGVASGD